MAKPKQVLAYSDLLAKVQGLLAFYPKECRNIHIDGLEIYAEQDDGANWRVVTYRRSGDDHDLTECREKIVADLRLLRATYDVDPKSRK